MIGFIELNVECHQDGFDERLEDLGCHQPDKKEFRRFYINVEHITWFYPFRDRECFSYLVAQGENFGVLETVDQILDKLKSFKNV